MTTWLSVLLLIGCALLLSVQADTEIANFHLPVTRPLNHLVDNSSAILSSTSGHSRLSVSSSEPERYIKLDLNGSYTSWTARISWPGSSPTSFNLTVYSSPTPSSVILHVSARQLTPTFHHPLLSPRSLDTSAIQQYDPNWKTDFVLVVEPLYLGFLPRTVLPTVMGILVYAGGAALVVPFIIRMFEAAASDLDKKTKEL